jgi:oleate hydratase
MNSNSKVYLVGGGIASLAAAVYLIQDAGLESNKIIILNEGKNLGGSLDAQYSKKNKGYIMRGIRMFEEKSFNSTFDLMSRIPSLTFPGKSLREVFLDYNKKNTTYSKSRLVADGKTLEQKSLKLKAKDRLSLVSLILKKEKNIEYLKIEDYFSRSFFKSNFWFEFCTVFAFKPWHSLIEFRRYFIRFIQDFPVIDTLEGIEITPYNQYESLVEPIVSWLKSKKVIFKNNIKVIDFDFTNKKGKNIINSIYCENNREINNIDIKENDFVFTTLGSMVANTTIGSMKKAPIYNAKKKSAAWLLWENIVKKQNNIGNPKIFNAHIEKSKWISFTITCKNSILPDLLSKYIDTKVSSFGGVNLVKSNWFMSLVLNYRPYFKNQAKGTYICWGFGLYSNKKGNYIKKKITECSGEEILKELIYHLGFMGECDEIIDSSICIPCLAPYATSQFLPRAVNDRPKIIPKNSLNFAFLGQYCENPHDVVFTVDYSVRCAQKAVYTLFNVKKKIVPIYNGFHHFNVILQAIKTIFR